MTKAQVFGTTAFEGDVDVNASGQWIAASRKGVFLSVGNDQTQWQEIFSTGGAAMVNANTDQILCRISDSGSWVVLNRAGLFRSTAADITVGELVTANIGTNNVYDVDMQPNGTWIASSSQVRDALRTGQPQFFLLQQILAMELSPPEELSK
jgi:hypothetical protein